MFDLCQRILLDGSSEKMISVGIELIENIAENFYVEADIMTVLDTLMELLLKNQLYADKKSLDEDEENNDIAFWSAYLERP